MNKRLIFIGGSPESGKSSVAKILLNEIDSWVHDGYFTCFGQIVQNEIRKIRLIDTTAKSPNVIANILKDKLTVNIRYIEDLTEGESLQCETVLFTRDAIIEFAKKYDPQPFHVDEIKAKESIFRGLIASSLHTLSACTRVVVEAQNNVAILSGVGMDEVKMFNPVRPGDVLTVNAWWADIKPSKSKPDRGFASIKCKVSNQDGQPVIEYGYRYLLAGEKYGKNLVRPQRKL